MSFGGSWWHRLNRIYRRWLPSETTAHADRVIGSRDVGFFAHTVHSVSSSVVVRIYCTRAGGKEHLLSAFRLFGALSSVQFIAPIVN